MSPNLFNIPGDAPHLKVHLRYLSYQVQWQ